MIRTGVRPLLVWGTLGVVAVPSLWYAWSVPGIIGLCTCIALAFVCWYRYTRHGAWIALVLLGAGMCGILGWQAATGDRCPPGDTRVMLHEGRAPVSCREIRASAASMAVFFGLVCVIGIGSPLYARRVMDEIEEDATL